MNELQESQRQAYLETMGIQSYFPRFVLPAAKQSIQCAWPQENVTNVTVEEGQSIAQPSPQLQERTELLNAEQPNIDWGAQDKSEPNSQQVESAGSNNSSMRSSQSERSLQALQAELSDDEIKPNQKTALEAILDAADNNQDVIQETEVIQESVEEVRFQLLFIRVNDKLSVLNQMPYIGNSFLSPSHKTLLVNILKALKVEVSNIGLESNPFSWPMTESQHVDKSANAAKAFLNAYLEQKQSEKPFSNLLVLGERVASYLQNQESPWKLTSTRSLDEMLTMPEHKREVWEQLKVLDFNQ